MRDELEGLLEWQRSRSRFALATVLATSRSAPRPAGAVLAVDASGRVIGNVSGGCVEPAVVGLAQEVLRDGAPRRARFGYSDGEALSVGLTCGGEVDILIRCVDISSLPIEPLAAAVASDDPAVLVTVVEAPDDPAMVGSSMVVTGTGAYGSLSGSALGRALTHEARAVMSTGGMVIRDLGPRGERMGTGVTIAFESFTKRPRMIVLGAIDYAAAVASMGRFLGFHVTVCDARATFATPERFPAADEVIAEWPHRLLGRIDLDAESAVCVLTHDPKFDIPAIAAALRTPAGYIGVMGSRRTHEDRLRRLRDAGIDESGIARLRSPIGLDLGGRTPQETAVSIAAELLMIRHGATGRPLMDTHGTIHREHQARTGDDR